MKKAKKFKQRGLPLHFIPAFRPVLEASEDNGTVTVTAKNAVLTASFDGHGKVTLHVSNGEFFVSYTGDGTVRVKVI